MTITQHPRTAQHVSRLDFEALTPRFSKAMAALDAAASSSVDDARLRELVRLRASQINGCAYCVDMHSKDAIAAGDTEQRLHGLPVWRETPFFTERERAALAFTEAVTVLTDGHVPHEVFAHTAEYFDDAELAALLSLIVTINAWNRIGVAARCWEPGSYQP